MFPTRSRWVTHRAGSIPTRSATALRIRALAWCGTKWSTWSGSQPTFASSARHEPVIRSTACWYTGPPRIRK